MQYAMQVIFAFLLISFVFIMVPRASVSANRVIEVVDTEITIRDPESPVEIAADAPRSLRFEDVTFSYPDAELPVLQDISFTAIPGRDDGGGWQHRQRQIDAVESDSAILRRHRRPRIDRWCRCS